MRKWIGFLVVVCLATSGCVSSLRKKFVRRKKVIGASVIAPVEKEIVDKRISYERHFVFVKVWMDEFISSMDDKNTKRQKKSKEEIIYNLEILKDYIGNEYEDKKKWIDYCIQEIEKIYSQLRRYQSARMPLTRLKLRVEELRRKFHIEFLPDSQPEEFWETMEVK